MVLTTAKNRAQFFGKRIKTMAKSFKTIYSLSPEKVDAFLNAYEIYNYDWKEQEKLIEELGVDYYSKMKKKLIDYYSVINHLCSMGQVEKMYIPPAMDLSKSLMENQNLYERKMMKDLRIKEGDRGLDVGCGRGRVANHVLSETKAHVTGVNIDTNQLEQAREYAQVKGVSNLCDFQLWDFNELPLPFADNSFDFIYNVQVFSYAKDIGGLVKELYRVLKPGCRFACVDWMCFDAYNPNDPYHASLLKRVKPIVGAIGTPSVKEYTSFIEQAGFEILEQGDPSVGGCQAALIENADKFFTRLTSLLNGLVRMKILPHHFKLLFDRLTKDADSFIEVNRLGLITSSYYILAEKKK